MDLKEYYGKFGEPWSPELMIDARELGSIAFSAVGFRQKFSEVLNGHHHIAVKNLFTNSINNFGDFTILYHENWGVNAYAATYDSGKYTIGIYGGLFLELQTLFSSVEYKEMQGHTSHLYTQMNAIEQKMFPMFFALCMVFYHELSHVVLGHVDFFKNQYAFGEILELSDWSDKNSDEFRFFAECDADIHAGKLVAQELLAQVDMLLCSGKAKSSFLELYDEILTICITAIHFFFCFLESRRGNSKVSLCYPIPRVRSLNVIKSIHAHNCLELSLDALVSKIEKALLNVEKYLSETGIFKVLDDFQSDLAQWVEKKRPLLNKHTDEFRKYQNYEFMYPTKIKDFNLDLNGLPRKGRS